MVEPVAKPRCGGTGQISITTPDTNKSGIPGWATGGGSISRCPGCPDCEREAGDLPPRIEAAIRADEATANRLIDEARLDGFKRGLAKRDEQIRAGTLPEGISPPYADLARELKGALIRARNSIGRQRGDEAIAEIDRALARLGDSQDSAVSRQSNETQEVA